MAAKKKTSASKKTSGVRVTNNATCPLKIEDVTLPRGKSAHFNNFDPKNAKYAAFIKAKMISVE